MVPRVASTQRRIICHDRQQRFDGRRRPSQQDLLLQNPHRTSHR
ncbi:hypothetical protein ACFFX0_10575 [Citricoccus parietis]|uniref:Uncharacterized protein n=1 Tax=Citricoccus parietis TaxID=592307 RepID=A0ABV5FY73_9MICC